MKRIFLALLLLAVAAPVLTSAVGCRAEADVDNPMD